MKKLLFLSLLATAMLFAACGDTNDEATPEENDVEQPNIEDNSQSGNNVAGTFYEGSIIDYFYEPDILDVCFLSSIQGFDFPLLGISTTHFLDGLPDPVNIISRRSDKYNEYVKYYGDTTFSGWIWHSGSYKVSAMPLNTINVTADKNFDSEHPAGTSLNDIFTLEYASAWNLIQSNYDTNINIRQNGKPQTIPLSEFKPLILPCHDMTLYFNKLPEKLGTYEFTITFDYGKDPISGREVKVAPAVVKAEFTEKDYVALPKR